MNSVKVFLREIIHILLLLLRMILNVLICRSARFYSSMIFGNIQFHIIVWLLTRNYGMTSLVLTRFSEQFVLFRILLIALIFERTLGFGNVAIQSLLGRIFIYQ